MLTSYAEDPFTSTRWTDPLPMLSRVAIWPMLSPSDASCLISSALVFLREAAALTTMARVAGSGSQDPAFSRKLQKLRLHHISAEREHSALSEASAGNLDRQFLRTLRESGQAAAEAWLAHGMSEPVMQQGMLRAAE
jgi:hypothetical protein